MQMPNNCQGLLAQYNTQKSTTTELVIMGPHGIMSIKIVSSSGGKKVQVFSGFDLASWSWNDRGISPTMSDEMWEHRYVESQEKSARKYHSSVRGLEPGIPDSLIAQLPTDERRELEFALISDEKVQAHWNMFNGVMDGVSSVRGADRTPQAPKEVPPQKSHADIQKERMAADELYGSF